MSQSHEITEMLRKWTDGKDEVSEELLTIVYNELHRQAARFLRHERPNHTLQTTALIHEAYMRLIDQRDVEWESRSHFFAIAARVMRRVLVDYARSRNRGKRGGGIEDIPLEDVVELGTPAPTTDLVALNEALNRLEAEDERLVRIVELRYFSGLTLEETADILGISRTTVAQDWAIARAWLHSELTR